MNLSIKALTESVLTETASSRRQSEILAGLSRFIAAHATDAERAAALLEAMGGTQEAIDFVKELKNEITRMLDLLALSVALEAAERNTTPPKKV